MCRGCSFPFLSHSVSATLISGRAKTHHLVRSEGAAHDEWLLLPSCFLPPHHYHQLISLIAFPRTCIHHPPQPLNHNSFCDYPLLQQYAFVSPEASRKRSYAAPGERTLATGAVNALFESRARPLRLLVTARRASAADRDRSMPS